MSTLPEIDPLKVAQKDAAKLENELRASRNRESQLETLAEALRDQRDERDARIAELEQQLADSETPVADITSLPPTKG